jgi:hypothetical protein
MHRVQQESVVQVYDFDQVVTVNAAMVLQTTDCKQQPTVLQVVGKLIALQMPIALLHTAAK